MVAGRTDAARVTKLSVFERRFGRPLRALSLKHCHETADIIIEEKNAEDSTPLGIESAVLQAQYIHPSMPTAVFSRQTASDGVNHRRSEA